MAVQSIAGPQVRFSLEKGARQEVLRRIGQGAALHALDQMLLIRNFEQRAEAAYQAGKIGGFFHSYIGQEAVQTSICASMGTKHWFTTSYRCHALALLLGATPNEIMSELFGRANGNALGRGGSMHLYTPNMLGGFGIVGGQCPVALGAAFTAKYLEKKEIVSLCFLGDGAVAQGAFHEAANLAALWNLPCIFVIENNRWGMGTAVERAISVKKLAEDKAPGYGMAGYTLDGMDFLSCYEGFASIYANTLKTGAPCLVEVITDRFKGHSISDPGLYRRKEDLKACMERDPIRLLREALEAEGWLKEEAFKEMDQKNRQLVVESLEHAEASPWPDPTTLEEDVFAP